MIKRLLVFLLCAGTAFPCGKELWEKKTLTDKDYAKVDREFTVATVADLVKAPAPPEEALRGATTRWPAELKTYTVTGYLVGFKKESDEDFHVVIQDLSTSATMIVEMVASDCTTNSELETTTAQIRASFAKRFGNPLPRFHKIVGRKIKLQVTGVGFFDFLHGQTGVAPNGFELHPLLSWKEIK